MRLGAGDSSSSVGGAGKGRAKVAATLFLFAARAATRCAAFLLLAALARSILPLPRLPLLPPHLRRLLPLSEVLFLPTFLRNEPSQLGKSLQRSFAIFPSNS